VKVAFAVLPVVSPPWWRASNDRPPHRPTLPGLLGQAPTTILHRRFSHSADRFTATKRR